ncbi:hypothetical protein FQN57_000752 [Myotisia sp. PD_48]|nr:hypothetical protein FQN57_000752 [Myotisia sp. PD_48]
MLLSPTTARHSPQARQFFKSLSLSLFAFRSSRHYTEYKRRPLDQDLTSLGHLIEEEYAIIRDSYLQPKHPIVLAHGLLGFDELRIVKRSIFPAVHYWRGIKDVFTLNGIEVIAVPVSPSGSIEQRAQELRDGLETRVKGRKVNIIAGLDARYMISRLQPTTFDVVSLTTIATPHRGSSVADYLFSWMGEERASQAFSFLERVGLENGAFQQLTRAHITEHFNPLTPNVDGVRYYSYGAVLSPETWSIFGQSRRILEEAEGPNDGLVSVASSRWGCYKGSLIGVSHLDLINWTSRLKGLAASLTGTKKSPSPLSLRIHDAVGRPLTSMLSGLEPKALKERDGLVPEVLCDSVAGLEISDDSVRDLALLQNDTGSDVEKSENPEGLETVLTALKERDDLVSEVLCDSFTATALQINDDGLQDLALLQPQIDPGSKVEKSQTPEGLENALPASKERDRGDLVPECDSFAVATPQISNDSERDLGILQSQNDISSGSEVEKPATPGGLDNVFIFTPTPTLILDASLSVVHVSNSHLQFSQLTREQCVGINISDFPTEKIPSPSRSILQSAIAAAISSREVQTINNFTTILQGSEFSVRLTPIFEDTNLTYLTLEIYDGIILSHGLTHEGSRGKRNMQDLLVDNIAGYAIYMLDPLGYIATWNHGAAILKGYSSDEIIGKHFSTFYGEADRLSGKPTKELSISLHQGKVEDEGWRYRKDGSRFWAHITITPIREFGHHVGFVKVARDWTDIKAAETRLITAYEEASKVKTDFLANMSHEVRTPMNGLLGTISLLKGTILSDQQREYTSIVEKSASAILKLMNNMLDYAKLSSGSFSLNTDVFNIEDVITTVVSGCRPDLNPGVELTYSINESLPSIVRGDPLQFSQIVQNLVENAVKFTEEGTVHINLLHDDIEEEEGNGESCKILVEVIDTGIGVPKKATGTLFSPFTRCADSSTKHYRGTGLGLSICKSLAELMSGSVSYKPNPVGQGSLFSFEVDLRKVDAPNSPSYENDSARTFADLKDIVASKHFLLVEDNSVNQLVMLKLLRSLGVEGIDVAWDGAEAVQLIKRKPLAYHLILMDILMPVVDGLEATSSIREMGCDVPIIAVTGNALKGDAETYIAKGMNDYLAKPIHRKSLAKMLLKWIGR